MTLRHRRMVKGYLFILPLLMGFLLFYGLPYVTVITKTLYRGLGNNQKFAGLSIYQSMLRNKIFMRAFGNTLKFLTISLPLILVISFGIAFELKIWVKKHDWLKSVLMLPYVMPVVGTVVLVQRIFAENGIINQSLFTLGLPLVDWLHSQYAFPVVVLFYLWKNTGYSVILLLSGLVTIPEDQYRAAELDGAGKWYQLRYITLPQMWYSFFFATVFSVVNAFKYFREIFLIGGTSPDSSIYMLQHFINNAFEKMNYSKLAVASVLLLLVILVVFALLYRLVLRKEAYKE